MFKEMFTTDAIWELLDPRAVIYLVIILLVFYLAKKTFDWVAPYNLNEQLTKVDNKAVALAFAGFIIGVGIVILSILSGEVHTGDATTVVMAYVTDLGVTVAWSLGGVILLHITRIVNDKIIFYKFSNVKELVEDKNLGTGAIEAGSYIGSAFIIHASLFGESQNVLHAIVSTLVFFIIGQIFFVIYGFIYQKVTRFDVHDEIERDNAAAGISAGMNLVAIGILLSGYIKHFDTIIGICVWFVIAVFLLLTTRYIVDKLILPGALLDEEVKNDRNWGAALVEGAAAITIAFIVNACFFL
ncbi:MAG: DUF350 domain-containing protein [Deltaproteobacteria bacterium]|nr:DUF350 domain-containing protein [Deltaproteobacteria bacterium]